MDEQTQQRSNKRQALRDQGVEPYANDFQPDCHAEDLHQRYASVDKEALEEVEDVYRVAGRIMALRSFGKAAFLKVADRSGHIQIFVQKNKLGEASFELFKKFVEVGDIVGVVGRPMRTKTGELSILAAELKLLTKSIMPLPEKWHGLKDVEIRYRRRYLDLVVNPEVRETFELRARVIRFVREFLEKRAYIEVETPMMNPLAGGATARPFVTHHNTMDMELFMRVAPELFLKRLLVGGLERVYELNRCFRNEGISTQHNPEFTMLEFYQAFATYEDLMDLTEQMLSALALEIKGSQELAYQGQSISMVAPFVRLRVHEAVAKAFDVSEAELDDMATLKRLAAGIGLEIPGDWGMGKCLMALFEEKVESTLLQPTFVCDFPLEVSPLSRKKMGRPDLVDRFELYVAGREMANAFSELNDPDDQRERFTAQMQAKAAGDAEAMPFDEDYVEALELGMPPAAGEGIGIDRLIMLLADVPSIRDVILFPLLRPEK